MRIYLYTEMNSLEFHNTTADINKLWFQSHSTLIKRIAIELGKPEQIKELTEKFLGSALKLKKHKDPNAPKKPKTGFLHFCDDLRPKIKEKQPELKMGGVMKELGKIWSGYTDEQKVKYNIKYQDSKSLYEEKLEEYNMENYEFFQNC